MRSRRGELSLQLGGLELLAPCQRPLPDLHHGLADAESRYRQRYLDLHGQPGRARRSRPAARALVSAPVARYLDDAGFIEVETPVLQPLYGGASARPFMTHHNELERDLYLRIATELYLKRLIVGGLERVYELGKDFRNEGVCFKHNPEFTMVEWYEAYADYTDGMRRTEEFTAASERRRTRHDRLTRDGREIDMAPPWPRKPLAEASRMPAVSTSWHYRHAAAAAARALLASGAAAAASDATWPELVDRALSHFVEPSIVEPVSWSTTRRSSRRSRGRSRDDPSMVERFEAFCAGMEFANGYSELNDPECSSGASRSRPRPRPPATRTPSRSTPTTSRRCATACPRPRDSASASTASRCWRPPVDPRRRALPGAAYLTPRRPIRWAGARRRRAPRPPPNPHALRGTSRRRPRAGARGVSSCPRATARARC